MVSTASVEATEAGVWALEHGGNAVDAAVAAAFALGVSDPGGSGLGFVYNSCLEFLDFENPRSPIYLHPGDTFPTNMAPTILRKDDTVVALGSAGSDRIAPSVCEVITNIVDRRLSLREAVVAPRVIWNSVHNPGRVCIEVAQPIVEADVEGLRRMGFETMYVLRYPPDPVADAAFFGGVNAVAYAASTGVFTGVGDPRRDGFAAGPFVAAPGENR